MTLLELLQCAKPLIFENNDAEFPYSIQGTCFMAQFQDRHYAITAKHCLHNRTHDSIRVRLVPEKLDFLPIKRLTMPKDNHEDFCDLAFFEINANFLPHTSICNKHFLNLDNHNERNVSQEEILAVVGYPTEQNSVDYENFLIKTQGYSVDGRYVGSAEDRNCSVIKFNNLAQIKDLDGLSGSPVLAFQEVKDAVYKHHFAGVLIRGTKMSGKGRFINSVVIIQALKQLAANP